MNDDEGVEDEESLLLQNLGKLNKPTSCVWREGGEKKSHVLGLLIENFGSFVQWHAKEDALPDDRGHYKNNHKIHSKLFTASRSVYNAQKLAFL